MSFEFICWTKGLQTYAQMLCLMHKIVWSVHDCSLELGLEWIALGFLNILFSTLKIYVCMYLNYIHLNDETYTFTYSPAYMHISRFKTKFLLLFNRRPTRKIEEKIWNVTSINNILVWRKPNNWKSQTTQMQVDSMQKDPNKLKGAMKGNSAFHPLVSWGFLVSELS